MLLTSTSAPSAASWKVEVAYAPIRETAADVAPSTFGSPVSPLVVVRPFDPPPTPYGRGHRGVDLGITPGASIHAAGAGVVRHAGPVAGRSVVSIQHRSGLITTYEPVQPVVTVGSAVRRGETIGNGMAGHPGCPAEACVHWGARSQSVYLDPLTLLGLRHLRLLPW
ncbi:M23 family metallopeptidase [Actinoalloteichus hymeniacidonis]|uniref:M23 family metallopeptidase n=1 Tax=Actinoalloteichus hymeniacidonis TaxID=340345 RepID=UPI001F1B8543|nr:M23 family metallopeptidase [Actinoalloteichus hymeniacidonis]